MKASMITRAEECKAQTLYGVQSVAVVQRAMRKREPAEELEEMGFGPLVLVGSFPVSMSGRRRQKAGCSKF